MSKSPDDLPTSGEPEPHSRRGRPPAIVVIAAIVILEAIGLLGAAGFFVYGLLTSTPASLGGAIFMLVLLLLVAGWLLVAAHFLWRGYRWTRAAILTWQLFMLVIAVPTLTGGYVLIGYCLLVPPVAAIVLLFRQQVINYTSRTGQPPAAL